MKTTASLHFPSRTARCWLALIALLLAGCWGEPRLDLRSVTALQESYTAMKESISPSERDRLRRLLIFGECYRVSANSEPQLDPTLVKNFSSNSFYWNYAIPWTADKTVSEIFAEAKRLRIPDDLPSVEDIIAGVKEKVAPLLPAPDQNRYQTLRDELNAFNQARDHIAISHVRVTVGYNRVEPRSSETWPRISFHILNKGTKPITGIELDINAGGGEFGTVDGFSFSSPLPPNSEQDISESFASMTVQVGSGFRDYPGAFEAIVRKLAVGRDLDSLVTDVQEDGKWLRIPRREAELKLAEFERIKAQVEARQRALHGFDLLVLFFR